MMRRNKLNLKNSCLALLLLLLTACSNETEVSEVNTPKAYTIHISVRSKSEQTRVVSDLISEEKIKRYDIFIYDSKSDPDDTSVGQNVVKYIGKTVSALDDITETFDSSSEFMTDKDIFVVVNNSEWDGRTTEFMKGITKTDLKATQLACVQNKTGDKGEMTAFGGYKGDAGNEPFIMSAFREDYNFPTDGYTLDMNLERTYAKVILRFKTDLDKKNDPNWMGLKNLYVTEMRNIPQKAQLFNNGIDYEPECESYVYANGKSYSHSIGADLSDKNIYAFDTFASDYLALRLFPHPSGADVVNKGTNLFVNFEVGPVGDTDKITYNFERRIPVGDPADNYRIKPNHAYVITVSYGKTSNNIVLECSVLPWNILYWEEDVAPS